MLIKFDHTLSSLHFILIATTGLFVKIYPVRYFFGLRVFARTQELPPARSHTGPSQHRDQV